MKQKLSGEETYVVYAQQRYRWNPGTLKKIKRAMNKRIRRKDKQTPGERAFVSRAEAESTTLKELLERYLEEVTPLKKGAEPETNRLRLMMRHPLARRFVAGAAVSTSPARATGAYSPAKRAVCSTPAPCPAW